ncbi:sn-glycerol-3-phosphate ABC transporter ATP-binding protein UgpC [Tistrella mobilis]|uniref:sn-glycerol-3-phosphate ABC transporter ATP-binding protein UgpC n=1 Tax=Tistrella mobilis TaxID=171437 RepID=UPI003556FB7D
MSTLTLADLRKSYADTPVIHGVDLDVADGEFVVLVGPSGCGKSTLLRMVAGLETVTAGRILIDGRVVNELEPRDRDIAMVFQNYALYPHMTVFQNMAYGLKIRGMTKAEIRKRVDEAAAMLGLGALLDRRPAALSGGQRQRVAMGRAIVREPKLFLFDEPLSNLDAKLRVQMRLEIKRLHQRLGVTSLYVTHDQVEAMTLADRLVVMNGGRAEQIGRPLDLYLRPATRFVAGFIGSPAMNFMPAALSSDAVLVQGDRPIRVDPAAMGLQGLTGTARDGVAGNGAAGDGAVLGLRPEDLHRPGASALAGAPVMELGLEVMAVEPLGADTLIHGRPTAPCGTALADAAGEARGLVTARLAGAVEAAPGAHLALQARLDRLHVFGGDGRRLGA